ncbi:HAMP domain-containing sensor histidine kinase [Kitasatospora sp. CMC57]|uniref:Sensor-like histidine kinase SenX3 n=1 Tax=Kitasatospora sp. CMC57 TaxID=3231513 RepID=A0AB33K5V1_9ACTN
MNDLLLIAVYAAFGAGAAGLLGWPAVRALRRRSVALSLFAVAVVTVLAMASGTTAVAQAMFLSEHDLGVVMTVLAIGAVVSLLAAAVLGRHAVSGSRALTLAARTVGSDGGFTAPAQPLSAELAQLSAELSATSARLAESRKREQTLEASRRELIAWISHDLRTPLAGLRAMAEALEDGIVEEPNRYYGQIGAEVERLTGMVDDLFELSRLQAGALHLTPARVSCYDLVGDALAGADPLARERGVRLLGGQVDLVPIEVDSREVSRALGNLLVNAIRSTPADGVVAVTASRQADEVVLAVTDSCGGIPEADLPRVFETGWRGGSARTPRTVGDADGGEHSGGGAGLGLAIVRGIAEAHAGSAAVRNVDGGCCFEIRLPAAGLAV